MIQKNSVARSAVVFGVSVIFVSLFSGCASQPKTMHVVDLENFQVNCRIKEQQIQLLQSMRQSRDDRLVAGLSNLVQPWGRWFGSDEYVQRANVHNGRTNWLINQHLMHLSRDC